jgi:hypothetical protein
MTNTDKVTNKVLEIIDQLQGVAGDAAHQAVNHLPDAVNLGLATIRVDGVSDFIYGLVAATIFYISYRFAKWGFIKSRETDFEDGCAGLAMIFGFIFAFFAGVLTASLLFDVWTYTKIFEPKIYLAHKVVEKVLDTKR